MDRTEDFPKDSAVFILGSADLAWNPTYTRTVHALSALPFVVIYLSKS